MEKETNGVLCRLEGVRKSFVLPNGKPILVLDGVTLDVRAQEILAVLGPSGCGKSTLMRILAGLIRADAGEVFRHGERLEGLNPGVAIVFQNFALYPWLSVRENVEEPLVALGMGPAARRAAVERVLFLVGLGGFEEAYPRELSGGMKQRVGIARALAVEPEILCMDEPFSQVDALTAETLRGEVVRFWSDREKNPQTIFMVSHDIDEVVTMATRIVVLGAHPGHIRRIIENPLSYPRDPRDRAFVRLVQEIHAVITESEMPDAQPRPEGALGGTAQAGASRNGWEALPAAGASEVVGVLEALDDRGGHENVFVLANLLGVDFGRILNVVKAAELLDFVDTPRQDVLLTALGRTFLAASVPERKRIFGRQVEELHVFRDITERLQRAERNELDEDVLLTSFAIQLPYEDSQRMLATLVNWGRHAEILDRDPDRKLVFLPRDGASEAPPS
jgi:NitT/TauT family transport system ATP-binding protein